MRKRQKMVLVSVLLSAGLLGVQSAGLELRYILIGVLSVVTWLLGSRALREGLSGVEWITVPLPLVLLSTGVGLFYILLPESWISRIIILVLFAVAQYALLLTANIFSVAAIRTIALFRAASAVSFAITLLTAFFLFNSILSFRLIYWQIGALVVLASWLMLLPALWSVKLEVKISRDIMAKTVYLGLMTGLLAIAISFWPISVSVRSLFLCTMLYVFLGIMQHYFMERLFPRTVWEYVTVGTVVTITTLVTAGWGV